MNGTELDTEMREHHDTGKAIAEFLGITPQTFCKKKKECSFTREEMRKIGDRYSLSAKRLCEVFKLLGGTNNDDEDFNNSGNDPMACGTAFHGLGEDGGSGSDGLDRDGADNHFNEPAEKEE